MAINWSTALPAATVLDRLDKDLVKSVKACLVFDPLDKRHKDLPSETWYQDLRFGTHDFPFMRLETESVVLAWQRPAYPSHVDEDVTAGRIGVVCRNVDPAVLERLVRTTATPLVGNLAKELVADAASTSK